MNQNRMMIIINVKVRVDVDLCPRGLLLFLDSRASPKKWAKKVHGKLLDGGHGRQAGVGR